MLALTAMTKTDLQLLLTSIEGVERLLKRLTEEVAESECDGVLEHDLYRLLALLDIVRMRLNRTPCQGEVLQWLK
jgi:hypothetical protein